MSKRRGPRVNRLRHIVFFLSLATILTGCGKDMGNIVNYPNEGTNIVCFGDSLTRGHGVKREQNYPSLLAERVERPVINAGIGANTTGDGLDRIEKDVISRDPYMVIIELGAGDVFQDVPVGTMLSNLRLIVEKVQSAGAISVICNIGDGADGTKYDFHGDKMGSLASETGSIYAGDLLKGIRRDPGLMLDNIHPNAEGYEVLAERIYGAIKDHL